jgi:hypothetical protein
MPRIDTDKLYEHIKAKAGRVKCPVCRRGPMTFSDEIKGVSEVWARSNMDQKPVKLVVTLSCQNCGGVSFIDPIVAGVGIIDDEDPRGDGKELK